MGFLKNIQNKSHKIRKREEKYFFNIIREKEIIEKNKIMISRRAAIKLHIKNKTSQCLKQFIL